MSLPRWMRILKAAFYRAKYWFLHYRKVDASKLLFSEYVDDDDDGGRRL